MLTSRIVRSLSAATLCAAALTLAACNNDSTPTPSTTGPATESAVTAAVGDAEKAAQAQLDQVTQYIKDNKLDAADKALTALEQNKASLPADIQTKLPDLRTALNAAKAAAGAAPKMP